MEKIYTKTLIYFKSALKAAQNEEEFSVEKESQTNSSQVVSNNYPDFVNDSTGFGRLDDSALYNNKDNLAG